MTKLTMDTAERVGLAKDKVKRLVDKTRVLLRQRASNEIVLYSDIVSKQLGRSYGAHAFISLQRIMFQHELVSLCALWDSTKSEKKVRDRDSIPAVLRLIDDAKVAETLVDETRDAHANRSVRVLNPSEDPEIGAIAQEVLARDQIAFAEKQASKTANWLKDALVLGRETCEGKILKAVKHFRDHHVAHALSEAVAKAKAPERLAKYGDEKDLFETTVKVVHWLHLGVNGTDFDWDLARSSEQRYAKAFWHGVRVEVLE